VEGEWKAVDLEEAVTTTAALGDVTPSVGGDVGALSLNKIENGYARRALIRKGRGRESIQAQRSEWDDGPQEGLGQDAPMQLEEGYYLVTTGRRLPDGSVLARLQSFTVLPDQVNEMPVHVRSAGEAKLEVLGRIDASKVTDKPRFILALVKESGEPTQHVLRQLEGDPRAVIVRPGDKDYQALKEMVEASGCGADPRSLPYVLVSDASGKVYYFSQGYNTVLREGIDRIFPRIP